MVASDDVDQEPSSRSLQAASDSSDVLGEDARLQLLDQDSSRTVSNAEAILKPGCGMGRSLLSRGAAALANRLRGHAEKSIARLPSHSMLGLNYKLLTTSTAFSNCVSLPSRSASRDNSAETAGMIPLFSNILPCQVRYPATGNPKM